MECENSTSEGRQARCLASRASPDRRSHRPVVIRGTCLPGLALDRLARQRDFVRPLDLGCGSGILAIAMAKLWAVPVLAIDNDPQAVAVARDNAAINGVAGRVAVAIGGGYGSAAARRAAPFDLVAANILARPLRRLAPGLARSLAPGGCAILSGLLDDQVDWVMAAHRPLGLGLIERRSLAGWAVLVVGWGKA